MPRGAGAWWRAWLVLRVLRLSLLLVAALLPATRGDINFTRFVSDVFGQKQHFRLIQAARIDYFSTEFNEKCPEVGAGPIDPPQGLEQRFQHPQMRVDPAYAKLPTLTYLDDGHLDNPYAGRVYEGEYTETVKTNHVVRDGNLLPIPHNRTQLCHYAIRLTPPEPSQNSAVWSRFKQTVVYGFTAEFHFRILHRSKECVVAGKESPWCFPAGADGFAFVIQNEARDVIGAEVNGLGYAFKKCIAVEFDTYHNAAYGERSKNHISVHASPNIGASNSARHQANDLAYADDIPPLHEGTHVVRITYDPKEYTWDSLLREADADLDGFRLREDAKMKPGVFNVELDGQRIISIPLDLVRILGPDPTETAQASPPKAPSVSAYDDPSPGKAWVGFTSSTSYRQWQSVDILSWTFEEHHECTPQNPPVEDAGQVRCRINEGTVNRSVKGCPASDSEYCGFIIQNAARAPLTFAALFEFDKREQPTMCDNGYLQWNHMHPWFLGCSREVRYPDQITELMITTLAGDRKYIIDAVDPVSQHMLQNSLVHFKRRSLSRYCVTEHKDDPKLLTMAECSCEYCMRSIDLSASYALFHQHQCSARLGLLCPCFEASEIDHDMSDWDHLEPMKYMRIHTCRECSYTSHCTQMLKVAICRTAAQTYYVGHPFTPTILNNGFQSLELDGGRVLNGQLRGDSCDCEPNVSPQDFPMGRAGMCSEDFELAVYTTTDGVSECATYCENTGKCLYFSTWTTGPGNCVAYSQCIFTKCQDVRCWASATWRAGPLGRYTTIMGEPQEWLFFPLRTLQSSEEECFGCLRLYDNIFCRPQCGAPASVSFVHWPAGQRCSSCMFAGNRMHELTPKRQQAVKDCVRAAIEGAEDPWVACNDTAMENGGVPSVTLFNGVFTHFLSECPGRPFEDAGAACVPNIRAKTHLRHQILSRMMASEDTLWPDGMECFNGLCELVPPDACYIRLLQFLLDRNFDDILVPVKGSDRNTGALLQLAALNLVKSRTQYVVSDLLPFPLDNCTLETWVKVGAIEKITNISAHVPVVSNSEWGADFQPQNAIDGVLATYWSSQLGRKGKMAHLASWELDLNRTIYGGAIRIYWKEYAANFEIMVSDDAVTWRVIATIVGNTEAVTHTNAFFKARYVKLEMTLAALTRPEGPGYLRAVYSIREFELDVDADLARLKPTNVSYTWHRPPEALHDGDEESYWAVRPQTPEAQVYLDLGARYNNIAIVRLVWRYVPERVHLYVGDVACNTAGVEPTLPQQYKVSYQGGEMFSEMIFDDLWSGQCIALWIDQMRSYNGEALAGISEIQVFMEAENLALSFANLTAVPDLSSGTHFSDIIGAIDGDPTTYWLVEPVAPTSPVSLLIDLGAPSIVISIEVTWATISGQPYRAAAWALSVGVDSEAMLLVDSVERNYALTRRVVVHQELQYVNLKITEIFAGNPGGRVSLQDIKISNRSSNLAQHSGATAFATDSWTNCSSCYKEYDGGARIHGALKAIDGDRDTWFGTPYDFGATALKYLDIIFPEQVSVELVVVRWKYAGLYVSILCFPFLGVDPAVIASVPDNKDYLTMFKPLGTEVCQVVRLLLTKPLEKLGGKSVYGVREIEVYNYNTNYALNTVPTVSDGTGGKAPYATDASPLTTWVSASGQPTNISLDMGAVRSGWGWRVLFSSANLAGEFTISLRNDTTGPWVPYAGFAENTLRDVFVVLDWTARHAMFTLRSTLAQFFAVRTIMALGSPNLALTAAVDSSLQWLHGGSEAVDGLSFTKWVSEPLCSSAVLRIDLEARSFVGGGITLEWEKDYQASDFDVYVGDGDSASMEYLGGLRNNDELVNFINPFFLARYVELRLLRPSPRNGDGVYSLLSFAAIFDPNMAHDKLSWATHTIDPLYFKASHAADGDLETIWMPPMGVDEARIVFDLESPSGLSGLDITWRFPPVEFALECLDPVNETWFEVIRYTATYPLPQVEMKQIIMEGFSAKKLAIHIYKTYKYAEGKMVALREVELAYADMSFNYARKVGDWNDGMFSASAAEVPGNLPFRAVDGDFRASYWMPAYGISKAWFTVYIPWVGDPLNEDLTPQRVGRLRAFWRFPPGLHRVLIWDGNDESPEEEVYRHTQHNDNTTDILVLRYARRVTIEILDSLGYDIGMYEVAVYGFYHILPPRIELPDITWTSNATYAVDSDLETYWMAPPGAGDVYWYLDLAGEYYLYDVYILFGYEPDGPFLFTSLDAIAWAKVSITKVENGLYQLEPPLNEFSSRYLKIYMPLPFGDAQRQLGQSIRDVGVYGFTNMARNQSAKSPSIWEYLPNWATDGDMDTEWVSRFGWQTSPEVWATSELIFDLGEPKNVAGMRLVFGYIAAFFIIRYSNTLVGPWVRIYGTSGNSEAEFIFSAKDVRFRGRYVKLFMDGARTVLPHPDNTALPMGPVFSVREFDIFEHTGGGGVVGIQSADGSQWMTIAYGLNNPGQWVLSSEGDSFTKNMYTDLIPEYGLDWQEDLETMVHLAVTFRTVRFDVKENTRLLEMKMYRNGLGYGTAWRQSTTFDRLSQPNQTRIVIGVRSTNFSWPYVAPPAGQFDPTKNTMHGWTHNPYFEGKVYNVTLIKNALSDEEVRGLYEVHAVAGGRELQCHCFDACPVGFNKWNRSVPVPCSGSGACRRILGSNREGYCDCAPGYSGIACGTHCTEIPPYYSCCEVDDDCQVNTSCDSATKACREFR